MTRKQTKSTLAAVSAGAPQVIEVGRPREGAMVGGMEGASKNSREMASWSPPIISPDMQMNGVKDLMDARGRDAMQNDGLVMGAVHTHKDSIVGSQFRLILTPDFVTLGADEAWAAEWVEYIESRFNLLADSTECWFDASRTMTLTDMIRLGVGGFVMTGEVLGTAEWLVHDKARPFYTAIQMVSPTRLSNPEGQMDTKQIRGGVEKNIYGQPVAYHIRSAHPGDLYSDDTIPYWKRVPAYTNWGRRQVLHIIEQQMPDQSRGISDMVAVLKQMRMTKKFQDITLQSAVVNATYAAAIESELPSDVVFASMGAGQGGMAEMLGQYMTALGAYVNGANNIAIDGVKMPHLFPGTKLSMKPAGTPGGVGTDFEQSLLRHIAAPLGLSYEQFTKDYTRTNYSSARASMAETWKYMQSRKKTVADRQATVTFMLWLEEVINEPNSTVPIPKGMTRAQFKTMFYDPIMREAMTACQWIGASRGQIDEVKETQAAIMRIKSGLSTYQIEAARLGEDFRKIFMQQAREQKMMESLGLSFNVDATKAGANDRQQTMQDENGDGGDNGGDNTDESQSQPKNNTGKKGKK
jgi:lambda family phage portal protein